MDESWNWCRGGILDRRDRICRVSLFTDVSRSTWVTFDSVKGVIGFAFCGVAGLLTARQTHHAGSGAAAGALGGAIAGITVPVSMYVLAYGFIDSVHQYPFEYYDYLSSGASTVQAFLLSTKGHADVLSTSIGLVPVVALFAAALGGAVGFFGGLLGRGRSGSNPEPTPPNTPLQPTSGEGEAERHNVMQHQAGYPSREAHGV